MMVLMILIPDDPGDDDPDPGDPDPDDPGDHSRRPTLVVHDESHDDLMTEG